MTTCKKVLFLLALVALLISPRATVASEPADEYSGNVSLELVNGTVSSTTESNVIGQNTAKETPKKNLPKTGEKVHFLFGLVGVLLVGLSGLLLMKRKEGGEED